MLPNSLQYFSAIYKHRSLGKASAAVGISQPALSKGLRTLEEEVGAPLFVRHSWGLEPTKFGQALSSHIEVITKQFTALDRDIYALLHAQVGSVQIGSSLGAATGFVPAAILGLAATRPGIRVGVVEGLYESLVGGVLSGALDLAITSAPLQSLPVALEHEALFDDPFLLAMAKDHPLADFVPNDNFNLLLGYPWVLPPNEGVLHARVVDLFARLKLRAPVPQVETFSLTVVLELMCAGRYLTLQPQSILRSRIAKPLLAWIDHESLRIDRSVICIWRRQSELSPAAEEFREVLVARARRYRTSAV